MRNTAEPAVAGLADDRADVVAADGVEGRRRLVEDDERRVAEERRREAEALLHALREAAGPVVGPVGEADDAEDALDLRRRGRFDGRPASCAWSSSTSRAVSHAW